MSAPNLIHDVFSSGLAQKVGWALVHFLWQGAAVALMLALMLQLLRRRSPQARWIAACAALGLMAALPVITAFLVSVEPQRTNKPDLAMGTATQARTEALPHGGRGEPPAAGQTGHAKARPSQTASTLPQIAWAKRMEALLQPLLPYFVLLWLAGVATLSVWHVGGWRQLQRTRRLGTRPVGDLMHEVFADLTQKLRVGRPVHLLQSARAAVPVVVGWLRPVVLLPASAISGLTPEQVQAVLAHELAHVRRHDCLVKVAQAVVETLLFYHPAVWWVSGRITEESEQCCDDLALEVFGDRQAYARALARAAELGHGAARLMAASSGGKLLPRVRRIMNLQEEGKAMGTRWVAGVTTIAAAALLAIGPLMLTAVAQPDAPAQQAGGGDGRRGTNTATGAVIGYAKAPRLQAATFGPVTERTVNDDSVGRDVYIDFDTGQLFTPPLSAAGFDQTKGIDALCDVDPPVSGLLGIDMVIRPIPETSWDTLGATELVEQYILASAKPGFPVSMSAAGKLPATFLFKTREGGIGILQIVSFNKDPRGVKIRYKIVQAALPGENAGAPFLAAGGGFGGGGFGATHIGGGGPVGGGGFVKVLETPRPRKTEETTSGPKILLDLEVSKVTPNDEELIWSPHSLVVSDGKKAGVALTNSFDYVPNPGGTQGGEQEMRVARTGVDISITPRLQSPSPGETRRTIGLDISLTVRLIRGYVAGTNAPVIGSQEYEATVTLVDGETKAITVSPEVPAGARGLPAPEDTTGPRYVLRVTAKVLPEAAVER